MHKARLKALRPFVTFDYDLRKPLSRYQKRKIKGYYDQLEARSTRYDQTYKPKSKKNLKVALKASGQKGRAWKAAQVRTLTENTKVSVKNGKLILSDKDVGKQTVFILDMGILLEEGADSACRDANVPRKLPNKEGEKVRFRYQILTGGHPYNGFFQSYKLLIEELDMIMDMDDGGSGQSLQFSTISIAIHDMGKRPDKQKYAQELSKRRAKPKKKKPKR